MSGHPHPADGSLAFLSGGGDMGARMRALDWRRTPLGPPEGWPQSLKTAVRIMLTSRQPIWIGWGEQLTYLYNDAYKSIVGGKHPGALGQPVSAVWREIWDEIAPMLSTAMTGDEGTYVEEQLLVMERNGYPEETYYTFSYSPIPEDGAGGGRAGGIICANTDDTRRVIGERQIALLRELAAGTAEARTWEEACERSARALASNPWDILFALIYMADPGDRSVSLAGACGLEAGLAAALRGAPWPIEEVLRTHEPQLVSGLGAALGTGLPTGAWRQPSSRAAVLPIAAAGETGRPGVLVVGLNPFRQFDDGYQGFLTLAAGQISASIGNARAYEEERRRAEKLAELDRAKTTFFSNVSHEFRTPLTLMLGPIEDILAKPEPEVLADNRRLLALVQRNGLRLQRLVNMLLDFSRIEAGRVQASYEPADLSAFTRELASTFRSACEKAGLELTVDCPPLPAPVYVDRDMWEKVVLNLVSNAFKFTLEGGIEVALRAVDGGARLTVRDTGAGIPPAEMPKLFERFHRVAGTPGRTQEGTGIGLALVQELVRLHGGEVRAESALGRGTTFFVTLPFGKDHLPADRVGAARTLASTTVGAAPFVEEALRWIPPTPDAGSEWRPLDASLIHVGPRPAGDGTRPRILLADDNSDVRDYIRRLLSLEYEVTAVADGVAALHAARRERPDLVLTDVMMPGLDGFGLLRELRADAGTRSLPIIMLSARAGEESRVEGMEAGADDYLVKPFSARELLARVGAHLQMARLRREAAEALRESHARFEAVVDAAPIGIYFVDSGLKIRQVNPKALPVFGDIENLIGSDLADVMRILWTQPYADEVVEWFRHTLETGEPYFVPERIEERCDRKVLEYYEWQTHRISLPDGQHGVVCYFNDISRHVLARQALAEADRRKDEFLATLAHELRNPLAPIRNMLEIMKRTDGDARLVEQARATMERQLNHMIRLIDDLLDVSRISRGKVELKRERVELASAVYQAVEACRPLAQAARHEVEVVLPPDPVYLDADPVRLAQIFGNMLNNSCKYTDPGGKIRLTAERRDGDVLVKIRDNGLGIPPDKLGSIFEIFTQVDRTLERSQGGLGLGLTLVKRLVEMHGGTVAAHSDGPGRGSEFVVRLPALQEQRAGEPSAEPDVPKATAGHRILVVDDNQDSALSLAMLLEISGHEVRTAYDGLEAIDAAAEFRPDIVLMDVGMPKLNGYDAARRIRAEPWGERMLLVAVTGWGQEEDRRRTTEAGFDGHLVKPVDFGAVTKLLDSMRG
ncbi:MAG TPA: ATP-binding protein [Thermoanaerobaculia bacterium]|nr:ATP-binding protein [Thermoanaerobaculia bacterium]